jgi:hypothetical protein
LVLNIQFVAFLLSLVPKGTRVATENSAASHVLTTLMQLDHPIFTNNKKVIESAVQFSLVYIAPYLVKIGVRALFSLLRVQQFYSERCATDPFSHVFFDFLFVLQRSFAYSHLARCISRSIVNGDILTLSLQTLEQLSSTLKFTFNVYAVF